MDMALRAYGNKAITRVHNITIPCTEGADRKMGGITVSHEGNCQMLIHASHYGDILC